MKHKTILIGCLVAVAGTLVLADHSNNQAVQTSKQTATVHAVNVAQKVKQELATRQQLQNQVKEGNLKISKMTTQCDAGLKDYNLLTSTQRLRATVPNCSF